MVTFSGYGRSQQIEVDLDLDGVADARFYDAYSYGASHEGFVRQVPAGQHAAFVGVIAESWGTVV